MKLDYIIGNGGHAASVIRRLEEYHESIKLPSRILYPEEGSLILASDSIFIAIGDNAVRKQIAGVFVYCKFPSIGCDGSVKGVFVGERSYIGPRAMIGDFCIINTGTIVEHDCVLEHFAHLAPGVVLGGHVHVGESAFIGLGAIVRDRIYIGNNAVVGMGSVVTHNIPDNCVAYGNPARVIKRAIAA